jgi:hypothetical protein
MIAIRKAVYTSFGQEKEIRLTPNGLPQGDLLDSQDHRQNAPFAVTAAAKAGTERH